MTPPPRLFKLSLFKLGDKPFQYASHVILSRLKTRCLVISLYKGNTNHKEDPDRVVDNMSERKLILSIDVGVKNLALCLLAGNDTNKGFEGVEKIEVLFWKWYDVTANSSVKRGTGKQKATNGPVIAPCVNIIRKTGQVCSKPGQVNARGRAYCGIHDPTRKHKPEDTQQWCFDMIRALPSIGDDIDRCIDVLHDDLQIVIEQQSVDNKKILMQGHLIYGFFVARYENKVPVRFVPAYNKLLVYDGPSIECTLKTKYAVRKYLGRKHTEHFLSRIPAMATWKPFFEGCKAKQDDVADAFLQGLYVMIGKPPKSQDTLDGTPGESGKPRRRRKLRF